MLRVSAWHPTLIKIQLMHSQIHSVISAHYSTSPSNTRAAYRVSSIGSFRLYEPERGHPFHNISNIEGGFCLETRNSSHSFSLIFSRYTNVSIFGLNLPLV